MEREREREREREGGEGGGREGERDGGGKMVAAYKGLYCMRRTKSILTVARCSRIISRDETCTNPNAWNDKSVITENNKVVGSKAKKKIQFRSL